MASSACPTSKELLETLRSQVSRMQGQISSLEKQIATTNGCLNKLEPSVASGSAPDTKVKELAKQLVSNNNNFITNGGANTGTQPVQPIQATQATQATQAMQAMQAKKAAQIAQFQASQAQAAKRQAAQMSQFQALQAAKLKALQAAQSAQSAFSSKFAQAAQAAKAFTNSVTKVPEVSKQPKQPQESKESKETKQQKEGKEAKSSGNVKCSKSVHILKFEPHGYNNGVYWCDYCTGKWISKECWRCPCGYDLCEECYQKERLRQTQINQIDPNAVVKCKQGHKLIFLRHGSKGFLCKTCQTVQPGYHSYRCNSCRYDVCHKCYLNSIRQQKKANSASPAEVNALFYKYLMRFSQMLAKSGAKLTPQHAASPQSSVLPPRIPSMAELAIFVGLRTHDPSIEPSLSSLYFILLSHHPKETLQDNRQISKYLDVRIKLLDDFIQLSDQLKNLYNNDNNKDNVRIYVRYLFAFGHIFLSYLNYIESDPAMHVWDISSNSKVKAGMQAEGFKIAQLLFPLIEIAFEAMFSARHGRVESKCKFNNSHWSEASMRQKAREESATGGSREINESIEILKVPDVSQDSEDFNYTGLTYDATMLDEASLFGLVAYFIEFGHFNKWGRHLPKWIRLYYPFYSMKDGFIGGLLTLQFDLIRTGLKLDAKNEYCLLSLSKMFSYNKYFAMSLKYLKQTQWPREVTMHYWAESKCLKKMEDALKKAKQAVAAACGGEDEKSCEANNKVWDAFEKEVAEMQEKSPNTWYVKMMERGTILVQDEHELQTLDKMFEYEMDRFKQMKWDMSAKVWQVVVNQVNFKYVQMFDADRKGMNEMMKEWLDRKLYTMYYLPDSIRADPIHSKLMPPKRNYAKWLVGREYRTKKFNNQSTNYSWFWPWGEHENVRKTLESWASDEEHNVRMSYTLSDLMKIIDDKKYDAPEEILASMKEYKSPKGIPLFWDAIYCLVSVCTHEQVPKTMTLIVCESLDVLFRVRMEAFWCWIMNDESEISDEDFDIIIEKLKDLYDVLHMPRCPEHTLVWRVFILHTLVFRCCSSIESKQKLNYDRQIRILQGLVALFTKHKRDKLSFDNTITFDVAALMLKRALQNKLDVISQELTLFYENKLYKDDNYVMVSKDTQFDIKPENQVLRQDKKRTLGRCRWGPIGATGVNKDNFSAELKKFGIDPKADNILNTRKFSESYAKFLVQIGGILQTKFQNEMRRFFETETKNATFKEAPVKTVARCLQKMNFDYKEEEPPAGAHILDIVRCLVVYDDIGNLSDAFKKFLDKYQVCRVKNNFVQNADILGNYRCVMINIVFEDPDNEDLRMICEVQMTLKEIFDIRQKMHKAYKVFRSILPENHRILF